MNWYWFPRFKRPLPVTYHLDGGDLDRDWWTIIGVEHRGWFVGLVRSKTVRAAAGKEQG